MRSISSTILLIMILAVLAGCQAKGGGSDSLVSDHKPTSNKFTIITPQANTFVEGETISIDVSFPFDMIVDTTGGNPQLTITIGATARTATYNPGNDPRILNFEYTVVALENDSDGITVNSLSLNGSTIQFDKNGVLTDCDVSTIKTKKFPNVKVDTQGPKPSTFMITNTPGFYNENDVITFVMTFSEPVVVTGTPSFVTSLDTGGSINTNYASGSGTSILQFTFTVDASYADSNGFDITSPLDLNGGTMKDIHGNDVDLDFSTLVDDVETYSSAIIIGGQYPYVESITLPANGTYVAGDDLEFTLHFDRAVNVSGVPHLDITIGSTVREAQYTGGAGTDSLSFRYTAVPGDVDANGITVATSITQNGGDITDAGGSNVSYFGDPLNNTFIVPSTAGVIINALQPMAISVTRNADTTMPVFGAGGADNVWIIGQVLTLTVGFNAPVYVTQAGGTPSISMNVGGVTRHATYLSGGNGQTSLVFSYTVQEGDLDTDNTIGLNGISLNGGVITDASNTNILLTLPIAGLVGTKIDGVRPVISNITPPTNGTYSTVAPLTSLSFDVNWSEAVNYSGTSNTNTFLTVEIGGLNTEIYYTSGNNTSVVNYSLTITNQNDSDGIAIISPLGGNAQIRDAAGNAANVFTFTPPNTSSVLIDTTAPKILSVTQITADGTYKAGEKLEFLVTFNESVTATIDGNYPRIGLTLNSGGKLLKPAENKTATTHVFEYTIAASDLDADGVVVSSTIQNSTKGHIRDAGRNNVAVNFPTPGPYSINVDAVLPTLSSRTPSASRAYVSGETIQISVTYSEPIFVDTAGGTPSIAVDFNLGTDDLVYTSGSGTNTLVFARTLDGTHFDMNGLNNGITTINLNGGTLRDIGRNNAPTSFASVDLTGLYVTYPEVKLWTQTSFTNMAPPPTLATVANVGAITTNTCGTSVCRVFNGDDALNLTGTLTGVKHVFMAFRTPGSFTGHKDIFADDITLRDQGANFDIWTATATINLNGTTYNADDTTHNVNIGLNAMEILHVNFTATRNFGAETLIPTSFNGRMGDVIAVEGALNGTQITNILNYLNTKY